MKKRLLEKLHSDAGETITEVLVALLISALALAMLASMIQASSNMITTSKAKMEGYYERNNAIGLQTETSEERRTFTFSEDSSSSNNIKTETFQVVLFRNEEIGDTDVIAYKEATP